MKSPIAIVLLAAGSSSRMGQSKQLLSIGGETLLLKSAQVAMDSKADKVVVVLGSQEDAHKQILNNLPLEIVHNPNWQKGMGTSLKAGLNHALKTMPEMKAVIIMVCDQPRVTAQIINQLIQKYEESGNQVVASAYSGTIGVPALFDRSLFGKLLAIEDNTGAKKILLEYSSSTLSVDFPDGAVDLDTMEDYDKFMNSI